MEVSFTLGINVVGADGASEDVSVPYLGSFGLGPLVEMTKALPDDSIKVVRVNWPAFNGGRFAVLSYLFGSQCCDKFPELIENTLVDMACDNVPAQWALPFAKLLIKPDGKAQKLFEAQGGYFYLPGLSIENFVAICDILVENRYDLTPLVNQMALVNSSPLEKLTYLLGKGVDPNLVMARCLKMNRLNSTLLSKLLEAGVEVTPEVLAEIEKAGLRETYRHLFPAPFEPFTFYFPDGPMYRFAPLEASPFQQATVQSLSLKGGYTTTTMNYERLGPAWRFYADGQDDIVVENN